MGNRTTAVKLNAEHARRTWGKLSSVGLLVLTELTTTYGFSVALGELILLNGKWYVTHSALLRLAQRTGCSGIWVRPVVEFCDSAAARWAFKAIVYKSATCRGFVGYGDADPFNVSPLVRGAEMRVAETRAVNRALRKAYGIGICSAEEIGSESITRDTQKEVPPQQTSGNGRRLQPRLRDRLCQLIRQHQLDAVLVKCYALDYCKRKTLNEATRKQIEDFIAHLADWAAKDKNALLCQLNSYVQPPRERAA